MKHHLTPFVEVSPMPPSREDVEKLAAESNQTVEEIEKAVAKSLTVPMFENNLYQIQKRFADTALGPMWHLSIRRKDRKEVHNWEDLQQIKNMMIGEDYEAVELYPMQSRCMNIENSYHLWCFMLAGRMFPFGYNKPVN